MLVKVMLILGMILLGTCVAWVYPRQDQNAEDDELGNYAAATAHGQAGAGLQSKVTPIVLPQMWVATVAM
jgi:hypothetical protein